MQEPLSHVNKPVVMLSGGFDPPTRGHVSMIHDASKIGAVTILLNSDEWCAVNRASCHSSFLPFKKRKAILEALPFVSRVIPAEDSDRTVVSDLRRLRPDFFGNGGSRHPTNTPEVAVCKELGIGMLWFLGDVVEPSMSEILSHAIASSRHCVDE